MHGCFVVSDNIVSPLGLTTAENFGKLLNGVSGIGLHDDTAISAQPFYAALFNKNIALINDANNRYTKFEQLLIASIQDALLRGGIQANDKKTLLIISSTKGNISLLETEQDSPALRSRVALHTSAKLVAEHFGFVNKPIVVSNACISGLLGILTGMRLLQNGQYENVVVAGADVITKFVLSGFQSFQAVSPQPCRPFDAARNGISLGEGAATIILSSNRKYEGGIQFMGGSVGNDANHISGPSRTGEELAMVIYKAMQEAGMWNEDIHFISAHGTATPYNDEMEAKAISLADLQDVPINSLKGYYGHTLGAAGLIECVVSMQSLLHNKVLPTIGYETLGVSKPINVADKLLDCEFNNCLKTASGFGGCNAALVFGKSVW